METAFQRAVGKTKAISKKKDQGEERETAYEQEPSISLLMFFINHLYGKPEAKGARDLAEIRARQIEAELAAGTARHKAALMRSQTQSLRASTELTRLSFIKEESVYDILMANNQRAIEFWLRTPVEELPHSDAEWQRYRQRFARYNAKAKKKT